MQDYRQEIENLLVELLELSVEEVEDVLKSCNVTFDKLNENLLIGIQNGYSAEFQFNLLRKLFAPNK